MGGEAAYRFAVRRPETFAAIAPPLSAYVDSKTYSMIRRIKDLPVWAIHGSDDTVIPLAKAQEPVDALKEAGSGIQFTVLAGYDHDTWTLMYSDPAFYDWLLKYQRP
jgi:predicted peptidase